MSSNTKWLESVSPADASYEIGAVTMYSCANTRAKLSVGHKYCYTH